MIAYKFLRRGAVGPFSRVSWPQPGKGEPGDWLKGVHACRPQDLPLWIFDELWEVELEPPIQATPTHVTSSAGRLRARIEGWSPRTAADFAAACAERTHELSLLNSSASAFAKDAATWAKSAADDERVAAADSACVARIAAECAEVLWGAEAAERERAWQVDWLTNRLALPA